MPNELGKYLVLQSKPDALADIQSSIQSIQDKFHLQLITGEVESLPWTIELPAGTLPIVVQIGKPKGRGRPIMKRTAELNLPTYHVDSDPLIEHVVPFPSHDADEFLGNFGKWASDYFVSDGNTNTFSFPDKNRSALDTYRLPSRAKIRWMRSANDFTEEEIPDRERELAGKKTSERGIYITGTTAQRSAFFKQLRDRAKRVGINTLVIDIKSFLARPFMDLARRHALLSTSSAEASPWLTQLVQNLHAEGFRVSGRIVVFKEDHLVLARPDLGVRNRATGGTWTDRKGGRWADPYSDEVQHFNFLISLAAAKSGIDEIQFDYIRFPTDGSIGTLSYAHADSRSHVKVIMDFLRKVRTGVEPYRTSLALDIFGVTAWQSKVDVLHLGQDLRELSHYLDVVSPMLYPSHFHSGYDGFANPGSHPYYFMNKGVLKSQEILAGLPVKVVPWIQGFNLRSPNYGSGYIREQIRAIQDTGINNYLIWNARNVYDAAVSGVR